MATQSDHGTARTAEPRRKHFTVDQANRALPYVSRILEDVRSNYYEAVRLQERLEKPLPGDEERDTRRQYEECVANLNRCVNELQEVGVELKDYEVGLVDFPAMHEGREVLLCYKSGEPEIVAWHEVDGGFTGRQPIGELKQDEAGASAEQGADESGESE